MEKDSKGSDKKGPKDHGTATTGMDPNFFAHSIFGGAAAAAGFNPMMMSGFPMLPTATSGASSSAAAAHAALASMAGGPAALGSMTQANAAWINFVHQMAAQDYLSRLQSGAAGLHPLTGLGYEALAGMTAATSAGTGSSSTKDSPGGLQLPDGTEIIKHTSSISGPKVPGTTNRGRKKTISLDPPFSAGGGGGLSHGVSSILGRSPATETRLTDSVTITPTSSKSTSDRLRELEMLGTKVEIKPVPREPGAVGHVSHTASTSGAQVTITPVASKGTTMLTSSVSLTPVERSVAARSPPSTDGPLNLSKKQPAKRRGGTAEPSPYAAALGAQLTPEQQLEQFRSVMASAQQAMSEAGGGGGQRRSRAKKLGVGVSRPKKNTVASLLANSRSSDDGQPGGSSGTLSMSTDELTIEVRPRCSTAPASAGDDDDVSVKSAGSDRKHKVTSSTDDPLNSYLARLKREYEDSSGLDSEELSAGESECEVSSSKGTPPTKRRRIVTDERKLRAPLERGWRRETTIRKITQAGPRGDVVYYAPCGKAFRQFPDILRYLERNNIGEVTRDHFTFSSKVVIGDYLKISEDGEECIPMSEAEVRRQVDLLCSGKKRQFKKPYVINIKSDESGASGSGSGSGSGGSNFQQAMELMRHLEDERRARQLKEEQRRKEREMKNSQMLEERRRKQEEIEKQKIAESVRKAQELNKQREMLYMLEVERERRRHHMLLVKALDARRRQEERDRRRQDMKEERAALKERRREKRLQDAEMSRELKKPREDMELADQKRLPELKRIPGLKLAGEAFAHCLMVFEFLHNFGETLGFDMESLPSLAALQQGLMNEPDHEDELLSVLTHLVVCAVEDPGIPHPVRHVTLLNQTLRQADVTHNALSEVLRIYMLACASGEVKTLTGLCPNQRDPHCRAKNADFQDAMEGNRTNQISQWLAERPFLALNPTEKIEVLAHLCNDLLQNKAVLRQIESTIEVVNSKRKEKWVLDGRLRRLKMLHSKKFSSRSVAARALPEPGGSDAGDTGDATLLREPIVPKPVDDAKEEEDEDDEKEESGNESEPGDDGDIGVDDGDVNAMTADELLKRIEQLNNHNNQLSHDIFDGNRTIRPTSLGHDRYQRACWVLPRAGGVYVEALESGLGADERYDRRQAALAQRRSRRSAGEKRTADSPAGQDSKRACVSVTGRDSTVEPDGVTGTPADRLPNGDGVSDVAPRLNGDCAALDGHLRRQWESEPVQARVKMEPAHVKAEPAPDTTEPAPAKVEPVPVKAELADEMRIQVDSEPPEADDFRVEDEPMEAVVHEELTGMDATTAKPEPTETADSAVGSEPAETKADVADTEPAAAGDAATTEPAEAGDDGASTEPLLPGSSGVKTEPASTPEKPCVQDSLSAIKLLAENPVPASARSSVILSTPTYTPQLNSKHIISYLNASLASLGANGSLREVNGAVQIPGLGLVPSQYLLQALQAPEKLWFSVLPKEPCDFTTIAELSDDEAEWLSAEVPAHSSQHQHDPQDESQPDEPAELQPIPEDCKVGWWRITDPAQIDELIGALHSRGIRERSLKNRLITCKDAIVEACSMQTEKNRIRGHPDEVSLPVTDDAAETVSVPPPDAPGSYRRDVALNVEMYLLEHVENLEERIAQASMQVKTWRLPPRTSGDRSLFAPSCAPESGLLDPVASARDRLCDLELNVERRYLKPPLGTSKGADLSLSNLGTEENNTIPRALLVWRDALPRTTTAAQVSMFLYALEMSVAWDKSIMKANCQFCTSGDHEEKLLLCDGCDKGYHTYCFKPAMDAIPDGDWYCYECVNKATGERACVVCGKGEGKVLLCEGCPRAFHPECVTPHVTKVPRGKWHCPACAHKSPKKSRSKKARPAPEPTEPAKPSDSRDTTERPTAPAERESPPKKERGNKKLAKEMAMCKAILAELESHDESWPFLLPVNTKQFPTYKKIIPNPMDLSTIKKRLNESVYKSRDEFLTDMRIIFDNCETFNEDDSPVGKAGHAMRDQFEARWLELSTP